MFFYFNMEYMATEEELRALAAQLRMPDGRKGIEVADMMHATNIQMTLQAIASLDIQCGDRILEAGHGNGGHLAQLMHLRERLVYYGLEISLLMMEEAVKKNAAFLAGQQAHFALYNGRDIPYQDDYFDKAFSVNTIYFWEQPELLLQEFYRVIKPGGSLAITFAEEEFMKQLPFTRFGFTFYNTDSLLLLAHATPFAVQHIVSDSEMVTSKTGEQVKRNFTTVSLYKAG